MTSRNPPSDDATTGTGTCTALSDAIISTSKSNSSDNSDTESLSSWGVIDYDFPSVIAAANNNYERFPPTVEAEDDVVVEVEVEDADVEKDTTVIVDELTSCSDSSRTDKTKHNNDDINNNNNNNTTIEPSSKKEGRERNHPNSTQPITENDCNNNGSENNHIFDTPSAIFVAPLDVDNNNNNDNDNDNNCDTNDNVNNNDDNEVQPSSSSWWSSLFKKNHNNKKKKNKKMTKKEQQQQEKERQRREAVAQANAMFIDTENAMSFVSSTSSEGSSSPTLQKLKAVSFEDDNNTIVVDDNHQDHRNEADVHRSMKAITHLLK